MARLGAVEVVALRISAFLLARKPGAETTSRVRAAGSTVTLAARSVLLILTSVGLRLLLVGSANRRHREL